MFHIFSRNLHTFTQQQARTAGSGLLFNGVICVLFAIAIFIYPDLLAHLVASFLMIVGVSLLVAWWKIKNWRIR